MRLTNPIFMVRLRGAGPRSAAFATDPRHKGEIKAAVRGGGTAARRELEGRHQRGGDRAVRDRPDVDAGIGGIRACGEQPAARSQLAVRTGRDIVGVSVVTWSSRHSNRGDRPVPPLAAGAPSSSIRPSSEVAPMIATRAARLGVTRAKGADLGLRCLSIFQSRSRKR
jgi:hypothetical protein